MNNVEHLLGLTIPELNDLAEQHNNCAELWAWAGNREEYNNEIQALEDIRRVVASKTITRRFLGE